MSQNREFSNSSVRGYSSDNSNHDEVVKFVNENWLKVVSVNCFPFSILKKYYFFTDISKLSLNRKLIAYLLIEWCFPLRPDFYSFIMRSRASVSYLEQEVYIRSYERDAFSDLTFTCNFIVLACAL